MSDLNIEREYSSHRVQQHLARNLIPRRSSPRDVAAKAVAMEELGTIYPQTMKNMPDLNFIGIQS
ncbi:hypothetical protein ACJIZ3_008961 [Penstemon smallii]|uniref:Uncharacterized protein n=1 Tax=Penstemon smallii TaxID=265156 RepID=A0ABD3TC10_9LAMI